MKKIVQISFFVAFICVQTLAQTEKEPLVSRFGAMATLDFGLNFRDPIFNLSSERKISVGFTYADKQRKFIGFIGIGARLIKYTTYTPMFRPSFIDELNENYTPVTQFGFDSLVGATMSKGGAFKNTGGGWFYAGFTWNNSYRPSLGLYIGTKGINSYGNGYTQFTDPVYSDIEYATLSVQYYELKFGCSPPFLNKKNWPFTANINIGYKLSDYGAIRVDDIPMSAYTKNDFSSTYRFTSCLTLSVSFQFWSNWVW